MSVKTIITEGYGIFGTVEDIITQGFVPGIGLEAEEGVALDVVARPVDFVFNAGWNHRLLFPDRGGLRINQLPQPVGRSDSDLKEMMELYSRWKLAA